MRDPMHIVNFSGLAVLLAACGSGSGGTASDAQLPDAPPAPRACGNFVVERDEQCDDGNIDTGDGCSATCRFELCPARSGPFDALVGRSFPPGALTTVAVDLDQDGSTDLVGKTSSTQGDLVVLYGDGAGGFAPATAVGAQGATPFLIGDIDGDGDSDLIVHQIVPSGALVMENQGGTLVPGQALPEVAWLLLALVDRDGDGDLDLLANTAGTVSWFPYVAGAYGAPQPFLPASTNRVEAGDVDGDGDVDLVAGDPVLATYLNDGLGSFAAATSPPPAIGPLADINGDGVLDLVTRQGVAHGTGDGTFAALRTVPDGLYAVNSVSVGDLDGDADPDVIAVSFSYTSMIYRVLRNDGGTLRSIGHHLALGNREPQLADVDSDGDLDLLLIGPRIEPNDGVGGFPNRIIAATNVESVVLADFDGDGAQEVVTVSSDSVLFHDDPAGAADGTLIALGTGNRYETAVAADLDADGNVDLVVANEVHVPTLPPNMGTGLAFFRGDGSGGFAPAVNLAQADGLEQVVAAHLDGDGRLDLAAADTNSSQVLILRSRADGGWDQSTVGVGASPESLVAADLDGDGDHDLAVANEDSGDVTLLANDGNGMFTAVDTIPVGPDPESIAAGDIDGDGDVDLAVALGSCPMWPACEPMFDVVVVLTNEGGTFTATSLPTGVNPFMVLLHDLDGDGDLDLATANAGSGDVTLYRGDGAGGFAGEATIATGGRPYAVAAGDLNGDCMADLLVGDKDGVVRVFASH